MKTTVIFDNFGPYHWARLRAAAHVCDLMAIQIVGRSAEYAWENEAPADVFKFTTLFQKEMGHAVQQHELVWKMNQALDDFLPQVVFIPGWSGQAAFAALSWCIRHNVAAVAMSESTEWDEGRVWWKEWVKRRLVRLCATAFVGGSPHKDYMVKLGMPPERTFLGYDAVDNDYFEEKAEKLKTEILKKEGRSKYELPENYFLASNRFIEKKNLPRLIEAYARYRNLAENAEKLPGEVERQTLHGPRKAETLKSEPSKPSTMPWDLVLLGDGPLRPDLCHLISDLRLQHCVLLPGFKQYPDLPAYYGLASAFIHASTTEQWGLVVNEAMASGLPVLVSNRCGCATDLVQEGVNGFTFDPYKIEQIAQLMLKISAFNFPLSAFGSESQRIISNWGPERFAAGMQQAVTTALAARLPELTLSLRLLLTILARKQATYE